MLPVGHWAAVLSQPRSGRYPIRGQRTFGDAIVQGCSRPSARSERCLVTEGTPASASGRALGYSTSTWERPPLIYRGSELSPGESVLEEPFSQAVFPLLFSSRSLIQVRSVKLLLPYCTHEASTLSRETC